MISYAKSLKSLFFVGFLTLIVTAQETGSDNNNSGIDTCGSGNEIDPNTYNLGLHVGALFIVFFTSSFGAFVPVISKRQPSFKIPSFAFFFSKHFGTGVIIATAFIHMIPSSFEMLSNPCLPDVWRNYGSWPGVIAMMSASLIFFIEYAAVSVTSKGETKEVLPSHRNELNPAATSPDEFEDTHSYHSHHSHAHAHGTLVLLTDKAQSIGIIILELGICLHSVIIGMALSVSTGSDFISLLIALVFHQMFEGLGLGSRIAELDYPKDSIKPWLMSLAYGTTTPIGIAIGLCVHSIYNPESATALIIQGVLDSISAGILLYAAFVELVANDFIYDPSFRKTPVTHQALAFTLLILGAGIMALIGYWA